MSPRDGKQVNTMISYGHLDPEARLGLPSGVGTTPSDVTCAIFTVLLGGLVYGAAYAVREHEIGAVVWRYLTEFQRIPIPIAVLTFWCFVFLAIKSLKIRAQRRALNVHFVPDDSGFVLTDATAGAVIDAIDRSADEPMRFLFLARCRNVLRMMRNLGRVSDVDDAFASRADQDESTTESGYTILRGFIWAIPVLGFIGTVIGLTQAMGRFGSALKTAGGGGGAGGSGERFDGIMAELTEVLGGLDTAFVTTAEALIAVIVIHVVQTVVRRADERLADDLRIACSNAVVSRVRIRPTEG